MLYCIPCRFHITSNKELCRLQTMFIQIFDAMTSKLKLRLYKSDCHICTYSFEHFNSLIYFLSVHYITFYKIKYFSSSQYLLLQCQIKVENEWVKLVREKKLTATKFTVKSNNMFNHNPHFNKIFWIREEFTSGKYRITNNGFSIREWMFSKRRELRNLNSQINKVF